MPMSELATKKFLIVDDFADMRTVLRNIVRSMGVTHIDLGANGHEAISHLEKRHYDVVLCDYNLGEGRDGHQVLEEAHHRQLIGINTIFVIVTAEHARDMVMAAIEQPPDAYLTKPFTRDLLQTRLQKLFAQRAYLSTVNHHIATKKYGAALAELKQLIAAAPRNVSELLKLQAEICLLATRYGDALAIYQQVLRERDVHWARLGMGKALFQLKRYAKAEETFLNLLEVNPNIPEAYDYLAQIQMALGHFDDAEHTLAAGTRISPRGFKRQWLLGDMALTNGHTDVAESAFNAAARFGKCSVYYHPAVLSGLAKSLTANGKHQLALKVIGQLPTLFPTHPETPLYAATATATVKANQGDQSGALTALLAAEQALTATHTISTPTLGLEVVKTYSSLGHHAKAKHLLAQVIANNHDDEAFLVTVKQVCQSVGMAEEGLDTIHQVQQEIVKTNNVGVQLVKQGQFEAAIQLLEQAATELPGNKTVNLNAAKAIIMKMERCGVTANEIQQVRTFVERVQRIAPEDWRLSDIKTHLQQLIAKL